ncbi:hypothetical protein TURU_027797 [Turdus rufiventris]|nr:hypothetical protein TURU_027797 [Turdus rufiventris]
MLEHVWSSTQKGRGDAGTNPELNIERMWSCWNKSRAKHKKDMELLNKIQNSAQKGCGDAGANPELNKKRMWRCCSKSRALHKKDVEMLEHIQSSAQKRCGDAAANPELWDGGSQIHSLGSGIQTWDSGMCPMPRPWKFLKSNSSDKPS